MVRNNKRIAQRGRTRTLIDPDLLINAIQDYPTVARAARSLNVSCNYLYKYVGKDRIDALKAAQSGKGK